MWVPPPVKFTCPKFDVLVDPLLIVPAVNTKSFFRFTVTLPAALPDPNESNPPAPLMVSEPSILMIGLPEAFNEEPVTLVELMDKLLGMESMAEPVVLTIILDVPVRLT